MREKSIRFVVILTAFAYALFVALQVIISSWRWTSPGVDIKQGLLGPQSVIALFIALAALTAWLLGRSAKLLSCIFSALVLVQFYFWWLSTQQVKLNSGLAVIPGTWLANWWAGANYLDAIALLAAVYLLLSSLYAIYGTRKARVDHVGLKAAEHLN